MTLPSSWSGFAALLLVTHGLTGGVIAAQRPEPRLGSIDFPTSASPAAQRHFVRGVLYLHSFEYAAAIGAFHEAREAQPDFAMAYWGEALAQTHPVWNEQDLEAGRAVLGRLGATPEARRAKAPTARERAYLEAVEVLYGTGSKAERDTAYSLAMARLVDRYSDDLEAKAFYALSLLGLNQGVRDTWSYMRAAAVAGEVFRGNPRHPGAAHYLIHAFDDPVHAPLGLHAARAYAEIALDAAHAQHMTTHIFVALGMWDDVVSQNAIAADLTSWAPGHYTSWLGYGLLQQGRLEDARRHLERARTAMPKEASGGRRSYLVQMRADYVVNTGRWDSPVGGWEIDLRGLGRDTRAEDAFVRGLSALRRGDRAGAERALGDLAVWSREAARGAPVEQVPVILEKGLDAALRLAAGDGERAVALMQEATALEDAMPFEFGPPAVVKPSHELFGEILLALDRPNEAQREFEQALHLAPRRALSLLGLGRAAVAAGDRKTAERAFSALREVWEKADADVPGWDEVKEFVTASH